MAAWAREVWPRTRETIALERHRVGARASPSTRTGDSYLHAVTATSSTNAWAAGEYSIRPDALRRTLILRRDGTAWERVASPNPGTVGNSLNGVAAVSSSDGCIRMLVDRTPYVRKAQIADESVDYLAVAGWS